MTIVEDWLVAPRKSVSAPRVGVRSPRNLMNSYRANATPETSLVTRDSDTGGGGGIAVFSSGCQG